MKKYTKISLIIFLLCLASTSSTYAGGGGPSLELTSSGTSATANGSDKVTFYLFNYFYKCDSGALVNEDGSCADGTASHKEGWANVETSIYTTSSDNTFGGTYTSGGYPTVKSGTDGKASVTVASTTAGSKTFSFFHAGYGESPTYSGNPSKTITFAAPVAATAPKTTAPKTTPTPAAPAEVKPPDVPKAIAMEVNGQPSTGQVTVKENESLTLKGTTVPNGVVKLFIFSEPQEATVTADSTGNWKYEVSGLEPGDHHIEAAVTDPVTSKTSERATLASFTVAAKPKAVAKQPAASSTSKNQRSFWLYLGAGGVVVLGVIAVGVWLWLKKRKASLKKTFDTPSEPPVAPSTPGQFPPSIG